ncbi:NBS-LRR [Rhynchospora pubera]|uniref:NBS-LRR n=1 Tax=Rhynchospora pubera TaxID=906938 RepID=A0AAV8CLR2_9POAL|nr:NBS-LRR [Rhynchospora pubera]
MPLFYDGVIPKSLGNLRGLQTLDARQQFVFRHWFTNVAKLQNLRRLFTLKDNPVAISKGIGNLKELQVLKWVDIERSHPRVVEELPQLQQLRKLGVLRLRREHYEKFFASIREFNSLRSLGIGIVELESLKAAAGFLDSVPSPPKHLQSILDSVPSPPKHLQSILDSVPSPPKHLQSIQLEGWIRKLPAWVSSLCNLTKVTLARTRLHDDAIVVLQQLPNLLLLRLQEHSYVGAKLTFRSAKFSKLKQLYINELNGLEELVFEEGTLPEFQTLGIRWCELKSGISGAEHLPKLEKLVLEYKVYVANLEEVQRQLGEHRPALEIVDP